MKRRWVWRLCRASARSRRSSARQARMDSGRATAQWSWSQGSVVQVTGAPPFPHRPIHHSGGGCRQSRGELAKSDCWDLSLPKRAQAIPFGRLLVLRSGSKKLADLIVLPSTVPFGQNTMEAGDHVRQWGQSQFCRHESWDSPHPEASEQSFSEDERCKRRGPHCARYRKQAQSC